MPAAAISGVMDRHQRKQRMKMKTWRQRRRHRGEWRHQRRSEMAAAGSVSAGMVAASAAAAENNQQRGNSSISGMLRAAHRAAKITAAGAA